MVKIKDTQYRLDDGSIDVDAWLIGLAKNQQYKNNPLIFNACVLSQLAGQDQTVESGATCFQFGLAIAEILADLDMDPTVIATAIILESYLHAELNIEDIEEQLDHEVAKLVGGVERMNAIEYIRPRLGSHYQPSQLDNIRKMLIAMVDDVRIVIIKLAERLQVLRSLNHMPELLQRSVATEVMQLYAPLANRLGLGQLKWELEDLAFRYIEPTTYKTIARGLKTRRVERDNYVKQITQQLQALCHQHGIAHAHVYGRSKHIHSIYRKMQRKNVDVSKIYDATAVRVLVDSVDDCYRVLSIAHDIWESIPAEFDDYIQQPKDNGYRSLHTAVIGPEERAFEIQIRTHEMHAQSELGVAAHWAYKEGVATSAQSHERKIAWLREVLSWQQEMAHGGERHDAVGEFFDDRVYIFTPDGDIIDLPKGSTPLDFAYAIHTDIGHRCRGAKINGSIVPLTQQLTTGDQVAILTTRHAKPSRDWINPHLGYLKSSRAKAKVLHWLKQQDYDEHLSLGKTVLEKELKKLDIMDIDLDDVADNLHFKQAKDMLAALGRGDLRINQILNQAHLGKPTKNITEIPLPSILGKASTDHDVDLLGVGNLMTYIPKCCKPLPGEDILGYVTIGRGIAIHRKDCPNILYALNHYHDRLIALEWGQHVTQKYPADITISAYDRHNLIHDITAMLVHEKAHILALNTDVKTNDAMRYINLTLEVEHMNALSRLIDKIKQISNIVNVQRVNQ